MSNFEDIIDTFKDWHKRYKWDESETIENFQSIAGCLEWEIIEYSKYPINKQNEIDWEKLEKLEYKKCRKLLFGAR